MQDCSLKQIELISIIKAYEYVRTNLFEMAKYLNVTEEFLRVSGYLRESLNCYRSKFGQFIEIDSYIIYALFKCLGTQILGAVKY